MQATRSAVTTLAAAMLFGFPALACLPGPDEPIEYLQEETVVLLQLQEVEPVGETQSRLSLPEITLYGDGAVIFVGGGGALMQAKLPDDAVEELLALVVDRGFLDFEYDQPVPDSAELGPITYLYVQTRGGAQAVKARGLGTAVEGDLKGDEFSQYRKLEELRDDLLALDPQALGAETPAPFEGDSALIWAELAESDAGAAAWPHPGVALAEIAADSAGGRGTLLRGEAGAELAAESALNGPHQQDGQTYLVSSRPLLPHENAFPEFDSLGR